ncbi:galactose-specific lectin nattectin-like [Cebidichthys violaceus]|uniref:galactose-specific lectin nattectin-like n=1 Tax=Cebidichthys violaceus TaxID=271503 RepID=UPI0035C9DF2A
MAGWIEHSSRCFLLSQEAEKWVSARRHCMDMGGDLATVWNAKDQSFLTHMTYQFAQQHPQGPNSVWIGLHDLVKEGLYLWVSGHTVDRDVSYWVHGEPNNLIPSWDIDGPGQDCVVIVPPEDIGAEEWLNSWDDIICAGERHYICETMALSLS